MWKAAKSCLRLKKERKPSITTISNLVRRCKEKGHVEIMKRGCTKENRQRDLWHLERVAVQDQMKVVKAVASEWSIAVQKTVSERT